MSDFYIRNPREFRMLKHLLEHGNTFRIKMDDIAGATNSPEHVAQIRKRAGRIVEMPCTRVSIRDRDGKISNPGYYWLTPDDIPIVKKAIAEWEKKKGARTPLSPENK